MSETQPSAALPARDGPEGIGGWLVLPVLALVASPIVGLVPIFDVIQIGQIENREAFSDAQTALIAAEFVIWGILGLCAPVLLLILMFKRRKVFPGWYTVWTATMPICLLLEPLAVHLAFPESFPQAADAYGPEALRWIYNETISAAVWIVYMARSERVANTFVN
jgi:Protein of unknown function (DUF2569)